MTDILLQVHYTFGLKKESTAEVDFLMPYEGEIISIETKSVKAGTFCVDFRTLTILRK